MWSVGVIMFIMLTGLHPFDMTGQATDEEIETVIKTDPSPPFGIKEAEGMSKEAKDLIQRLMEVDPKKRIRAGEFLKHPYFNKVEAGR